MHGDPIGAPCLHFSVMPSDSIIIMYAPASTKRFAREIAHSGIQNFFAQSRVRKGAAPATWRSCFSSRAPSMADCEWISGVVFLHDGASHWLQVLFRPVDFETASDRIHKAFVSFKDFDRAGDATPSQECCVRRAESGDSDRLALSS
jgi:hypothetical protein